MATPKFKWNPRGFEAIRRSSGAQSIIQDQVSDWLEAAGGEDAGYKGGVVQGQGRGTLGRAIGTVVTYSNKAKRSNAKNQTLLRVFGGSR